MQADLDARDAKRASSKSTFTKCGTSGTAIENPAIRTKDTVEDCEDMQAHITKKFFDPIHIQTAFRLQSEYDLDQRNFLRAIHLV